MPRLMLDKGGIVGSARATMGMARYTTNSQIMDLQQTTNEKLQTVVGMPSIQMFTMECPRVLKKEKKNGNFGQS
jgi:hypothetical protein